MGGKGLESAVLGSSAMIRLMRRLFMPLWTVALAFAVFATITGVRRSLSGGATWPSISLWFAASILFMTTACLALPAGRRHRAAALLSLSLVLVAATNFMAQPFWPKYSVVKEVLANAGWVGLIATLLVFPRGKFVPRWSRWVLAAAAAFYALDVLMRVWLDSGSQRFENGALFGFAAFFASGLIVLGVRMSRAPPGLERQQLDWLFAGFSVGILLILAPLCVSTFGALLGVVDDAYGEFGKLLPLLVPLGFCSFAAGLIAALSGNYLPAGGAILRWSAVHGLLTLLAALIFALMDQFVRQYLEAAMGEGTARVAGTVAALISTLFLKPLRERLTKWVKAKFGTTAEPAT